VLYQIVDRCHVGQSFLSVVRYFISRLKPGAWKSLPRAERRRMLSLIRKRHASNRRLYTAVMNGTL